MIWNCLLFHIISPNQTDIVLSVFEAVFFPLIVQICFGTPQVDDLRAAFSVFFHQGTTFTVVRIRNTLSSANNTPAFIRTVIAFIAHSSE